MSVENEKTSGAHDGHLGWLSKPWSSMADLAEAVDDLICSFDYMDTAMDNLAMLIFIWILISLAFMGIARWLYSKYTSRSTVKPVETVKATPVVEEIKKSAYDGIINSTDSVLATSAKVKSNSFHKPKANVPASPMAKRRLTRMSPGPDLPGQKRPHSVVIPTCTGPDPVSVQWVNDVLVWLYHDLVIVNELVQLWICSMNEYAKKSVEEQGIGVELVRSLETNPPNFTNIFCECDTKEDVTITCDCEATPAFQLKAFRQKAEKVEVSHYRVNVNRFRARLNIVCITEKLTGELRCDGWPEVKVALAPVGAIKSNQDEQSLQNCISEIVIGALRNTQLEFNFAQYPTCPRLRRHVESPQRMLPLHYDSMLTSDRSMYASTPTSLASGSFAQFHGERRLLVKVVGAKDIGGKDGCRAPYCVVEMDEPPQKNQTAIKKDTTSPVWDEHFLFDLSPHTAELLFEVYDRLGPPSPGGNAANRFLGLGLVGIDELLVSPSQRQLISLQKRPMEEQDVTGVLTVEFLFIDGGDMPDSMARPFKLKETLRTTSPTGQTFTTTKTTLKNGHDNATLTESALKEIELNSNNPNKTTLIIHSVQREPRVTFEVLKTASEKLIEAESRASSKPEESTVVVNGNSLETCNGTTNTVCNNTNGSVVQQNGSAVHQNGGASVANGKLARNGDVPGNFNQNGTGEHAPEATPRKKRRDFFGTIKRRLGRSKTRGQSMDLPESGSEDQSRIRSISADRNAQDHSMAVANRSVYSAGTSPAQSGDDSRTSRSSASARTFIHEASTLVLETIEAGMKKHYLVPLAIAQKSRWRRKGVKLHIYKDHTFIAKHLAGGTVCGVCAKNVARRIGKQGYECRDCQLKCHKHCHVNVTDTCQRSTVPSMELTMLPVLTE